MKRRTLKPIPTATVSTFHGKDADGRDTETWKVTLVGHNKESYLKLTNDHLLTLTELAASQVGRALGLKIPQAYLVTVYPSDIPVSSQVKTGTALLCFASQSCGADPVSFERLGVNKDAIISRWADRESTIIFDEWIANTDRHDGNLVYDPQSKAYWLIDHGRALTGMPDAFIDLSNPAVNCKNQLLNDTIPDMSNDYKMMLHQASNKLMLECQTIDLDSLDSNDHYSMLNTALTRQQVIDFLSGRINETTRLLCSKLGMPMLTAMGS